MRQPYSLSALRDERYLLVDDTDEDASQILTVICDGDPRSHRGFDFDAYGNGGVA